MSELLAIGVSHKTAPVEIRERLALTDRQAAEFLRDIRGAADVQEAVAISTCNRTELYLVASDPVEAESMSRGTARSIRSIGRRPRLIMTSSSSAASSSTCGEAVAATTMSARCRVCGSSSKLTLIPP